MNDRQRLRWEQKRSLGQWRFVLVSGVLQWGGIMFLFSLLLMYLWTPERFDLPGVLIMAALWATAGFLAGLWGWSLNEKKYHRRAWRGHGEAAR